MHAPDCCNAYGAQLQRVKHEVVTACQVQVLSCQAQHPLAANLHNQFRPLTYMYNGNVCDLYVYNQPASALLLRCHQRQPFYDPNEVQTT